MADRPTLKETRRAACREALVGAAQFLMAEVGFEGTTIEAIAHRAGVAKGTFYLHFSGKDEILRTLFDDQTEKLLRGSEHIAERHAPARDQLIAIAELLLVFHQKSSHAWMSLLFDKGVDRRQVVAHFREKRQRMLMILRDVINAGITSGQIVPEDPDRMASLFLGCVQGMVNRCLDGPDGMDCPSEAKWLVDRLFHGVAAHRPGGGR